MTINKYGINLTIQPDRNTKVYAGKWRYVQYNIRHDITLLTSQPMCYKQCFETTVLWLWKWCVCLCDLC